MAEARPDPAARRRARRGRGGGEAAGGGPRGGGDGGRDGARRSGLLARTRCRGPFRRRLGGGLMAEVTYREAIIRALADSLAADDSVFLLGEDIAAAGGVFKTTEGLQERFGGERVLDTPISEQAIVGLA